MTTRFVTMLAWWFIILFLAFLIYTRAHGAQAYYSPVTINSGQVPSTQTDFPILISVTDARLKTTGNGGHVADAQGDDIRPYSDSGLTTAITGYEKVFYDGTNGILEMWVKRSSVSDGLVTYLGYGDTSLTSDGSSSTTWSNGFVAVYHLKDGTTLDVNSSTGSNNGTNSGATAATGKIDGCAAFNRSSQSINLAHSSDFDMGSGDYTFSAWIKPTDTATGNRETVFGKDEAGGRQLHLHTTNDAGSLNGPDVALLHINNDASYVWKRTPSVLSDGIWANIAVVRSGSSLLIYVNGTSQSLTALTGSGSLGTMNATTTDCFIGKRTYASLNDFFGGSIDEARVVKGTGRSANWLTVEHNNQSAPGTFETLGTEVAVTGHRAGFFMFFPN